MRTIKQYVKRISGGSAAWVSPTGEVESLNAPWGHHAWAEEHGSTFNELLSNGWIRVAQEGPLLWLEHERPIVRNQLNEIINFAIEHQDIDEVCDEDTGQILWSRE